MDADNVTIILFVKSTNYYRATSIRHLPVFIKN